jgi:hypothetical protein
MKKMLYMLAAAATLAACHNRSEDEMGAAPDRGDTTAVRTDSTTGGFDTTSHAQPSDTSMTPANPTPTDTTSAAPTTPTTPTDTTSSAAPAPTTPDTTSMPSDSGMSADSSGTSGYSPSTGADSSSSNPTAGAQDSSMTQPPGATDSTKSNQ